MSTTSKGASGGKDVSAVSQAAPETASSTAFVPDGGGVDAAVAATDAITASAGAVDQVRVGR